MSMRTKRKVWVISDTHFGHSNIIDYCDRPFENTYYMNKTILDNWNGVVSTIDLVYHLGDVYFPKGFHSRNEATDFLRSLNGHKRLILGNHDNGKDQALLSSFEKILMWRMFPEFKALLTHVPVHESSIRSGLINFHGHIHNKKSPDGPYKNVSVEVIGYTPVLLGETKSERD